MRRWRLRGETRPRRGGRGQAAGVALAVCVACVGLAACPETRGPLGNDGPFDPASAPAETPLEVTRETLANGLRLVVIREGREAAAHDNGIREGREAAGRGVAPGAALLVPFDPAAEPVGLEGESAVLVRLAITGTDRDTEHGSPSARALALGATLTAVHDGAALGWVVTGTRPRGTATGLPDAAPTTATDASALLAIILDVAIAPELPGTALATDADRWRARLESDPDLASEAAMRWAVALTLGFGRPVGIEPTALALGDIHREAVIRVHRRLVRPERAVVVVTGPVSATLRARLEAWQADSMQGTPPDQPCAAPPFREGHEPDAHARWPGGERPSYALRAPDEHAVVRARPIPGVADRGRAAWDAFVARAALLPPPVGFGFALRDVGEHGAAAIRWATSESAETEAAWLAWLGRIEASADRVPVRGAVAETPLALARQTLWPTLDATTDGATIALDPVLAALRSEAWSTTLIVSDVPPPGAVAIGRDRALCPLPEPPPD